MARSSVSGSRGPAQPCAGSSSGILGFRARGRPGPPVVGCPPAQRGSCGRIDMKGVVLITGASTGIGYQTALRFAREGYRVVAGVRTPARAAPLADAAKSESL